MKLIFKSGDRKIYKKVVEENDLAIFHGELLHEVCSTFSLGRDFEWTSRLFFIDMKDEDEEGVGTFLNIDHKNPAFVGEEITFIATVLQMNGNELKCAIEAVVNDRQIAVGSTGQKMLKKTKLKQLFSKTTV